MDWNHEHRALPQFLETDGTSPQIDQIIFSVEGRFRYRDKEHFRTFMRLLPGAARGTPFTSKGRLGGHEIPYLRIRDEFLFLSEKITYGQIRPDHAILKFTLKGNVTRYISNHPNSAGEDTEGLEDILRCPTAFKRRWPEMRPTNRRIGRFLRRHRAEQVCLDGENNILDGVMYARTRNVAARFAEYVQSIIDFLTESIRNAIITANSEDDVSFEMQTDTLRFKHFEVYHDFQCADSLALTNSMQGHLGRLADTLEISRYKTGRDINSASIVLPLRTENRITCAFYAKTMHRFRVEMRYHDSTNIGQVMEDLQPPWPNLVAFATEIIERAATRFNQIYAPLQRLIAEEQLPLTRSLLELALEFFSGLLQAANGDKRLMQELLSVFTHHGGVARTAQHEYCLKKLAKAGIVRAESIRPNSRGKVYILMPQYIAILQALNACDTGARLG